MTTYASYLGFVFKGLHSSNFGVYHISDNAVYKDTFYGDITENTKSVMGQTGVYYGSTTIGPKTITLNCYCTDISMQMLMKIKAWLYPLGFGTLVLDEEPYKQYTCKVSNSVEFGNIPTQSSFNDIHQASVKLLRNNGAFTLTLLMVEPFAYSTRFSTDTYEERGQFKDTYKYDSGILLTSQTPSLVQSATATKTFYLYNAGNIEVYPKVTISGYGSNINVLREVGDSVYEGFIIDSLNNQTIVVDCAKKQASIGSSAVNYKFVDDTPLRLNPTITIERHDFVKYTTYTKTLTLMSGDSWGSDVVGRRICVNDTWYQIAERTDSTNIVLVSGTGLANNTIYSGTVIATLNTCRISGSPYPYTSKVSGFNIATSNVLAGAHLKNPLIKGKTTDEGFGVTHFYLSTHNTSGTIYQPDASVEFPLMDLPNGVYDSISDTVYTKNINSIEFTLNRPTLVFGSKMTTFNEQTLQNVSIYPSVKMSNNVTLYDAGAPTNANKSRFFMYSAGYTLFPQVEASQIDLASSIGKYYYEYEVINGVPTCTVYYITTKAATGPQVGLIPIFDVEIDTTSFSLVDVLKIRKGWYTDTPATPTVVKDNMTRIWRNSIELIETGYTYINASANAGTKYYINAGNELWLILQKGLVTSANMCAYMGQDVFHVVYQRYVQKNTNISARMSNLVMTNSSDYVTINLDGGAVTPSFSYDIDMTPKPFDVEATFSYKHKYI